MLARFKPIQWTRREGARPLTLARLYCRREGAKPLVIRIVVKIVRDGAMPRRKPSFVERGRNPAWIVGHGDIPQTFESAIADIHALKKIKE